MSISFGTIRRRYDQGLDSIVRLVIQLEDRIEDLTAMQVAAPQRLIVAQAAEIKQLKQTVANKDAELVEAHQINRQLQTRIREIEKFIEADHSLEAGNSVNTEPLRRRDSHNSNQPPSLDLPWLKPKRTRSLRKQSGLRTGGQLAHPGVTLSQVAAPHRIVIHPADNCRQCGATLVAVAANNFHKRQVFEIENGSLAVIEHRLAAKVCPSCRNII